MIVQGRCCCKPCGKKCGPRSGSDLVLSASPGFTIPNPIHLIQSATDYLWTGCALWGPTGGADSVKFTVSCGSPPYSDAKPPIYFAWDFYRNHDCSGSPAFGCDTNSGIIRGFWQCNPFLMLLDGSSCGIRILSLFTLSQ